MAARLDDEDGMGLIELLVAMTIIAIGVMALVAGFSSGHTALDRASKTSTAGTLADQQMEQFRRGSWESVSSVAGAAVTGVEGETYWIESVVESRCPDNTVPAGSPPSCTLIDGVASRPLKRATVTVREGSATGRLLISESSTFDQSTG